jgi:hypothetical protein
MHRRVAYLPVCVLRHTVTFDYGRSGIPLRREGFCRLVDASLA